jgi:DNA-binding NarL/FixJ family response regulator
MMKILLVDDHKITRDGLRTLVEKESDMKVVGEAENGRRALELTSSLQPDVVIMDVTMSDMNGIEATRQVHKEHPETRVIALSMHSDVRYVLGMLDAGASGYLLKDCAFEELARAIRSVSMGQTYLSPGVTDIVVKDRLHRLHHAEDSAFYVLTEREREVLQLLAEGKSARVIADMLHVSVKTIETHRRQIMGKLNLFSIAELTKYAIREGVTSLDP